jgi:hypothetical protein
MPAHTVSVTRTKRPLTCDACTKPVDAGANVTVCGKCGRVRHDSCTADPCGACGGLVQRSARYGGKKMLRYL